MRPVHRLAVTTTLAASRCLGLLRGATGVPRQLLTTMGGASIVHDVAGEGYAIAQFPARSDNYGFLLHDAATGATAAIDTPEVAPILAALRSKEWTLTHILNTHHHHDHAGGNAELRRLFPEIQIVAPRTEVAEIGHVDTPVGHGDAVAVGSLALQVIDVGGHTLGHVAYYAPQANAAFVGDAIFAMGCGRMFEGTYPQFHASLARLAALPDDTALYCAHEYTAANARFAVTVEPENADLLTRVQEVAALRKAGKPTVPTTVLLEKKTNPFIRYDAVRASLGLPADMPDVDVFATVRQKKDRF